MKIIAELKQHYLQQGLQINKPATQLEIDNFEQIYQVRLPEILKAYFLIFNGTGEANFGDEGFSFFSLDEFKPVQQFEGLEDFPQKNCFVFSEYLLWMSAYAIALDGLGNDLGIYEICNSEQKVFQRFEDFLKEVRQDKGII